MKNDPSEVSKIMLRARSLKKRVHFPKTSKSAFRLVKWNMICVLFVNLYLLCRDDDREKALVQYPPGTKLKIRYGQGKNLKMYEAKASDSININSIDEGLNVLLILFFFR